MKNFSKPFVHRCTDVVCQTLHADFEKDSKISIANIDGEHLTNWDATSQKFSEVFRFPPFYGGNSAAFTDMMSDLDWYDFESIIIIITNRNGNFLKHSKHPDEILSVFNDVGKRQSTAINDGEWWDRSPVSFYFIVEGDKKLFGFLPEVTKDQQLCLFADLMLSWDSGFDDCGRNFSTLRAIITVASLCDFPCFLNIYKHVIVKSGKKQMSFD